MNNITPISDDNAAAQPKPTKPETILVERREKVGLITLNRPKALNALNRQLAEEVLEALRAFDADSRVGAIVIAGSPRAFAAGARRDGGTQLHRLLHG